MCDALPDMRAIIATQADEAAWLAVTSPRGNYLGRYKAWQLRRLVEQWRMLLNEGDPIPDEWAGNLLADPRQDHERMLRIYAKACNPSGSWHEIAVIHIGSVYYAEASGRLGSAVCFALTR